MKFPLLAGLTAAVFLSACGGSDNDDDPSPTPTPTLTPNIASYTISLSGSQEVPMVMSNQSAEATISVNTDDMILTAEMNLSEVNGVAAAHIHAGEVGINGAVAFAFADDDGDDVWEVAATTITTEQYDDMLDGLWYVNVHTDNYASGELRGQIITDTHRLYLVSLNGEQEVPSVDTEGYGEAYILFDTDTNEITVNAWSYDFEATAAHIHMAEVGLSGGVTLALAENTETSGLWQAPMDSLLTVDEAMQLEDSLLYVNMHSAANASGEVRGQILGSDDVLVIFDITPGQEVPQVSSDAMGIAYATLDTASGSLVLNAWVEGLSPSAAHIHQAPLGENGSVVVALEENAESAGLWQVPENTALDSATQEILIDGGHYLNFHTEAYPSGEIRAQILPRPWEVVTFEVNGAQQTPPLMEDAMAEAYAKVNTSTGDLDLLINTTNAADATTPHIHAGVVGEAGSIVASLLMDETNSSVWRTADRLKLSSETLSEFLDAGHYVNLHTPTYPDGEARGQVLTNDTELFLLTLSGSAEVPAVDTMASGWGGLTINTSTGSLRGAITVENMEANAAHIHQGGSGENGAVILALEANETGFQVPADTVLDSDQIATMLSGGYYVNVHSETYPSGEIRAQVAP